MAIEKSKAWDTSMLGYSDVLNSIIETYPDADILELGAGRRPSYTLDQLPGTVRSYTVNDISQDELDRLPEGYESACFNVSGDASNFGNRYDVVFSRFLAEHVPDGVAMHRNVHKVLKKGGTAFHLIPTLYALPFVLNKYIPESVSEKLWSTFAPGKEYTKKFPASYSACYSNPGRMTGMLSEIGYSKVDFQNFYGHFYYDKFPGLKQVHARFSEMAAKRDWHVFGTYAYIIARK